MKKSLKLISLFIIAIIAIFVSKETVFAADSSPAKLNINAHKMTSKPLGLTQLIHVKKTSDGKYVYCFDAEKTIPDSTVTYTKANLISDPAISYIIASGYNDKNDEDFFATQAALWIYLVDTNQKQDTNTNYIQKIKTAVYSSSNANDAIAKDIKNILEGAKKATEASNKKSTFEIATEEDEIKFTLKNGEYVSNVIKINSDLKDKDYSILLYSQPKGTTTTKVSNGFIITIPEENLEEGTTTIGAVLHHNDTETIYNVYKYSPSNSKYQNMLAVYSEKVSFSDDISIKITKEAKEEEPEDPTTIVISKQDITNKGKELSGATLVIKNSKGKIVEKWVSGNKAKTFDDLEPGKYTLEEIKAPEGYILSSEEISFTVKEDGKTKKITMYNTPEEPEELVVSISKQDITTKEEVPGATLIIRDSEGKELYRWVSGDEPYIIKGIEEGTYTLEEIIAPEGYILSNEKITFEVKDNKVVTEVVMFNTPVPTIIEIPSTGSFASTIGYILGGLIIITGSVLIYRNVKKEQ